MSGGEVCLQLIHMPFTAVRFWISWSPRCVSGSFPHLACYNIGLHGPDLLFFYKPLSQAPIKKARLCDAP